MPALGGRRTGNWVLATVVMFAAICTLAQVLRSDLDWMHAPLSFYLLGDYGWLVKSAYVALGTGLALLGFGYYHALAPSARSGAPVLLFATAGLGLDVTALADSDLGPGAVTLEAFVHGLAATTAFLCVTVAMLLQSVRLRLDAAWRARFAPAFTLAALAFATMWLHALWREPPRGLMQKLVIALILAWLAQAAIWLRRDGNARTVAAVPAVTNGSTPE